jgi:hypothetical protein
MDPRDLELRNATYRQFVELGRAPSADELARAIGSKADDVRAGWQRLHAQHALVLNPGTSEIRMANPFSAMPTAYRVNAAGRWWYANCAWDAFGIFAALHEDGRIETSCPDCGEALSVQVKDAQADRKELLYHNLLPAAHWWDDIIYT